MACAERRPATSGSLCTIGRRKCDALGNYCASLSHLLSRVARQKVAAGDPPGLAQLAAKDARTLEDRLRAMLTPAPVWVPWPTEAGWWCVRFGQGDDEDEDAYRFCRSPRDGVWEIAALVHGMAPIHRGSYPPVFHDRAQFSRLHLPAPPKRGEG